MQDFFTDFGMPDELAVTIVVPIIKETSVMKCKLPS